MPPIPSCPFCPLPGLRYRSTNVSRKLRPPSLCHANPAKTRMFRRPCLDVASASAVWFTRSRQAFGFTLPRFVFSTSKKSWRDNSPSPVLRTFARNSVVTRLRLAPDLRLTLRVVLTACVLRLSPQYTLHSSLRRFPKFTRSPLSIPVDFR